MSIGNYKEIKGFPNYYVTEDGHVWKFVGGDEE